MNNIVMSIAMLCQLHGGATDGVMVIQTKQNDCQHTLARCFMDHYKGDPKSGERILITCLKDSQ